MHVLPIIWQRKIVRGKETTVDPNQHHRKVTCTAFESQKVAMVFPKVKALWIEKAIQIKRGLIQSITDPRRTTSS